VGRSGQFAVGDVGGSRAVADVKSGPPSSLSFTWPLTHVVARAPEEYMVAGSRHREHVVSLVRLHHIRVHGWVDGHGASAAAIVAAPAGEQYVDGVTGRDLYAIVTAARPALPRSSSMTTRRSRGQPSVTGRSTGPYCRSVLSAWRVTWLTEIAAHRRRPSWRNASS
jgi:hypothetical protein